MEQPAINPPQRGPAAARAVNEQIFRRIFEEANEGIWILDEQARIQLINPRMAQMVGYSEAEMLGRREWDFVAADDQALAREHFERRRRGVSEQFEIRFSHKDGSEVWTVLAARPIFEEGQFRGALDLISDHTAFKQAQLRLGEAQSLLERRVIERTVELQEAISHLESFSYSVAHDLRAPLRAISGYAYVLEEEHSANLNPAARELLRRMADSALRMDHLIRDVLNYSCLVRGKMPLMPVDLGKLVRGIVNDYSDFKQLREPIEINCDGFWVCGNQAAMTQAISNFLTNALKFVPPGVAPRVRLWCEVLGENIRFHVDDNGVGIPSQLHKQVWGVFHRLHTSEYPGTGIGLAIVKEAVERMGGQVGVTSELGKGSSFWFELPRAAAPVQ